MTMLLMTLDSKRGEMRWASAGHDPPLVYDAGSDNFLELVGGNLPLGVMDGTTYDEYTLADVRTGQIFLAGTDGIWETADSGGEMFGKERLCELIRRDARLSAAEISQEIRGAVERFRGDRKQDDDITFVIVKTL